MKKIWDCYFSIYPSHLMFTVTT